MADTDQLTPESIVKSYAQCDFGLSVLVDRVQAYGAQRAAEAVEAFKQRYENEPARFLRKPWECEPETGNPVSEHPQQDSAAKSDTRPAPGARGCPFCGSLDIHNWQSTDHDANAAPTWSVMCFGCESEGPHTDSEQTAIALWNLRSDCPIPRGTGCQAGAHASRVTPETTSAKSSWTIKPEIRTSSPSAADIERVALALFEIGKHTLSLWDGLEEPGREFWRKSARAAIAAMPSAAPSPPKTTKLEEVATAIKAEFDSPCGTPAGAARAAIDALKIKTAGLGYGNEGPLADAPAFNGRLQDILDETL